MRNVYIKKILASVKKREYLILFIILLLGAGLRFSLLSYTEWFSDPSRDLLVPQHMLLYHEVPNLGHVASGTNPIFYYPPLYFYLLAFIQIPSMNLWYVLSVLVLLNVVGIGIFYFIVRRLSNATSALLTTIVYACSSYFVHNQTSFTAYRFDLPILLTGTLFHLVGVQKKKPLFVYVGLFFLVIASSINYAVLILMPVFLLWTVVYFRHALEKVIYFTCFVYIIFVAIFFNFARFVITNYSWHVFLLPFSPQHNLTISSSNFVIELFQQSLHIIHLLFPNYPVQIFFLLLAMIVFFLRSYPKKTISILYPASFLLITIVLASAKNNPPEDGSYYFYSVTPFLLMMFGICLQTIKRNVQSVLFVSVFLIAGWIMIRPVVRLYNEPKSYQTAEAVSSTIISELKQIQIKEKYSDMLFWRLRTIKSVDAENEMTTYAYIIEKKVGKLLRIYDHYNNLEWIGSEKYVVIICLLSEDTTLDWCKNDVSVIYPKSVFLKQIPTISSNPVLLYKNL